MYKAALERLTCCATRIEVAQLEPTLMELQTHDPRLGHSQLEEQFVRLKELSPRLEDSICRTALQFPHKNRNRDHLPSQYLSTSLCVCVCVALEP